MLCSQLFGLVLCLSLTYWQLLALVGCLAPFPFLPLIFNEDKVTEATYKQIKLGMTLKKVRNTIGRQGYDRADMCAIYGPKRVYVALHDVGQWNHKPDDHLPGKRWEWHGWDATIAIRLGKDGRVTDKMIIIFKPLMPLSRIHQIFAWRSVVVVGK